MVRPFAILLSMILSTFFSGCVESASDEVASQTITENPLKGKWKLFKRKYDPDTVFRINPDTVAYVKLLTEKTFIWYNYDKESGNVIALAGGSYDLEGESYMENIEFYHPPGTFMEGSAIPFKCEVIGDEWHHYGYISEREYDEDIGDYVVLKERRLEEIWKKVE